MKTRAGLAVLLLLLVGCTTVALQTQVGHGLEEFAQQFLEAGQLYDAAYREGLISRAQYQTWADAVPTIKAGYDQVYQAWLVGDDPVKLREQLRALKIGVAVWVLKLQRGR